MAGLRKPEGIHSQLARCAASGSHVLVTFKDGRLHAGGLVMNPIRLTFILINPVEEYRVDFVAKEVASVRRNGRGW